MSSSGSFNDWCCTTVRSGVVRVFFGQNKHFLNLPVPGIDIAIDWLVQHPTDQYTHAPKSAANTFMFAFSFCLIYAYFPCITFSNPFLFVTHIRSHGTRFSPFPTTERALIIIDRKKMFKTVSFFHGVSLRRTGVDSCHLPI